MTEDPGLPADAPRPGRHRDTGRRNRTALVLGLVVAILAAAGLLTWLVRGQSTDTSAAGSAGQPIGSTTTGGAGATRTNGNSGDESCPLADGSLDIAAAPEIAGVLSDLTSESAGSGIGCAVTVTTVDPATFVSNGPSGADVWVPDSSMWVERANAAGIATTTPNPSVATSPVVLALSSATAGQLTTGGGSLGIEDILATRQSANAIRVGLPDPRQSAAAVGTILAARASVTGTSDARAALTWAVRSSPAGLPIHADDLLGRLSSDPNTAVPVSELAVVTHNRESGSAPVTGIYPASGGVALDYPVVGLTGDPNAGSVTDQLVQLLIGATGRAALLDAGFRAPDGSPGAAVNGSAGVNPAVVVTAALPALQAVEDAIHTVDITNEPSRMLAVIDVSGSMLGVVPDANGATRMELAIQAATRGLALYPADSEIGLWVFSRTLTPTSDHRELIPISTLGPDGQGGSGAQRLAQALAGIKAVPDGGTGLYDTTLDAVRAVRAGWDPNRVNSVLILSDGMNDDLGSISLDGLLSTLAAEQDAARPVPVISIAFGPDSDVEALSQISKATGGAAYESRDPRQVGEIFLDAVGQRLCRPSC